MKKIILWSLLTLASSQSYSEELIAIVTYDNKKKTLVSMEADTRDIKKMEKCSRIISSNEGIKILKLQAKNKKAEIIKLKFICNL